MVMWREDAKTPDTTEQKVSFLGEKEPYPVFEAVVPDDVFLDMLRALPADTLAEYRRHVAGADVGPGVKGPEPIDPGPL